MNSYLPLSPSSLCSPIVRLKHWSRKILFVLFWQNIKHCWSIYVTFWQVCSFHSQFLTAAVEVFTEFLVFWWLRICSAQFSVWLVHSKMSRFPKLDSSSPRPLVTAHCAMGILSFTLPSWVWHNTVAPVGTTNTQHSFILLFKQHKCIPQFWTNGKYCGRVWIYWNVAHFIQNCDSRLHFRVY